MGARQYNPGLGRFLQTDPIEGGSANNYDYVHGNPVGGLDLAGTNDCGDMGLNPWTDVGNVVDCVSKAPSAVHTGYQHIVFGMSGCFGFCFGIEFQGGYVTFSS